MKNEMDRQTDRVTERQVEGLTDRQKHKQRIERDQKGRIFASLYVHNHEKT